MNRKILLLSITLLAWLNYANPHELTPISRSMPDSVDIMKDIKYINYSDRDLFLDLYRATRYHNELLPTILVIRSGGWRKGDKDGFAPMAAALALRGFAAICIEYRTFKEALFPAAVLDIKSAVKWIKDNADKYDLDPKSIGAIGGSAGAHLALLLGVSSTVNSLNPTNNSEDFKIQAVVGLATPTDFSRSPDSKSVVEWLGSTYQENEQLWHTASPTSYIDKDSPPTLFIHSSSDQVVSFENSVSGVNQFGASGIYSELVLLPDAPHAFWNFTEWFTDSMDKAAFFFHEQLKH